MEKKIMALFLKVENNQVMAIKTHLVLNVLLINRDLNNSNNNNKANNMEEIQIERLVVINITKLRMEKSTINIQEEVQKTFLMNFLNNKKKPTNNIKKSRDRKLRSMENRDLALMNK
jgi:hypothetical protein